LRQRKPVYSILKTSLPAAIDLASQPVTWLIEAVFIGRLSAAALGGVGFALQIVLLTSTMLLTFVMGAIILINRKLGSEDSDGANHILGQTLMLGILIAIPVTLLWYFASPLFFQIIREKDRVATDSASASAMMSSIRYMQTLAFFAPALVVNFIAVGIVRGSGETHISMIINGTINAIHLLLTPALIYGLFFFPRMDVRGAAMAMGCAHTLGLGMTIFHLRKRSRTLFLSFKELTTPKWESIKTLFKMGFPTTVEQLIWAGGQLVVTGFVASISIGALAIHQVFLRIQAVLSMFYLGFGMAAMTSIGKNLGAKAHWVAEKTSESTHRIVLFFVLGMLAVMIVFSDSLIHFFIRREETALMDFNVQLVFLVFALTQVPKALNTVISGSLRGAGDIQWVMWLMVASVLLFEIGVNWPVVFVLHVGLIGVWLVQFTDEMLKCVLNIHRFKSGKWKLIHV
jgi:putative MATE family efflux protein